LEPASGGRLADATPKIGALGEPAAEGVRRRIGTTAGTDLAVEVRDVPIDRVRAEAERAGDLRIRLPACEQHEDFKLAWGEPVRAGLRLAAWPSWAITGHRDPTGRRNAIAKEREQHGGHRVRVGHEQRWLTALEQDKLAVRQVLRQHPGDFDRDLRHGS